MSLIKQIWWGAKHSFSLEYFPVCWFDDEICRVLAWNRAPASLVGAITGENINHSNLCLVYCCCCCCCFCCCYCCCFCCCCCCCFYWCYCCTSSASKLLFSAAFMIFRSVGIEFQIQFKIDSHDWAFQPQERPQLECTSAVSSLRFSLITLSDGLEREFY